MVTEAGVQVLLNTRLADVLTKDGSIEGVLVLMKEGLTMIQAKQYIDRTGDADLAYHAGVPTWLGDKETGIMQPTSLFFEVSGIDREAFVKELDSNRHWLDDHMGSCFAWLIQKAKENGDWTIDRSDIGMYEQNIPGRWKVNTSRMAYVDATNTEQTTTALMEGRRQAQEILFFLRKYVPSCENAQIL